MEQREAQAEREARPGQAAADTRRWRRTNYLFDGGGRDVPPCVPGCAGRSAECHGRCEAYQAWSRARRERQDAKYADRDRQGEITAYIRDNWARRSKRRAKYVAE